MDPRALANTTARRIVVIGGFVLLAAALAAADVVDVPLAAYLAAERGGDLGTVAGRVYAERRKPDDADRPMAGATAILLPRSDAFLRALESLRHGARESATAFREAATAIRRAREDYELRLWEAGAADLVRASLVDADGAFLFGNVPAGAWVLVVTHATPYERRGAHAPPKDRTRYALGSRVVGFAATVVWLRQLTVGRDGVVRVDLTDRNYWFTGVVEDRERDAGR